MGVIKRVVVACPDCESLRVSIIIAYKKFECKDCQKVFNVTDSKYREEMLIFE